MTRDEFFKLCLDNYGTEPDYPFKEDTAVFRHHINRKWYAIIMSVPKSKFGFETENAVDVVNLKLSQEMKDFFRTSRGVYPAYHMNKTHWVSVILDEASDETVELLTDESFSVTRDKIKKGEDI